MKIDARPLPLLLVLSAALSAACGDDPPLGPEDVTYAPELGVDLDQMTRLESGVYVQTLMPGLGSRTVVAGDSVEVAYTLWLPDGTEIDSSEGLSRSLDTLLQGFQDGVLGMVEGEVRLLLVPPELGYGSSPPVGSGIPPDSVLVFRVELIAIHEDP